MAKTARSVNNDTDHDLVWGAEAIGRAINRAPAQVYYLIRTGALAGAVRKLSHRQFVGSREQLRKLPLGK